MTAHVPAHDALTETLRYARLRIPYYAGVVSTDAAAPRLEDFPVVSGDLIASQPESFSVLDSVPDIVALSGGTSGQPKFFFYDYDELEAGTESRTGLARGERIDPAQLDGIALLLVDLQHGLILPPAHGQPVVSLPLEVGRHFATIVRFLEHGLVVRGRRLPVIELYGSITKLRALTRYLQHRGIDATRYAVRDIVPLAFHTSARWRRTLAAFWNAKITEAYGMTEFLGVLTRRCEHCGGYHLPSRFVHAEMLDDDLAMPVKRGAASLVLTSLLPLRKVMPLIRYDTRDLVEALPFCPIEPESGFVFHGRRENVLRDPSDRTRVAVSALDVLDALEDEDAERPGTIVYDEEVATVLSWGLGDDLPDFRGVGYPQAAFHASAEGMEVIVETEGGGRRTTTAARVRRRIASIARDRHGIDAERFLRVRAVRKGMLKEQRIARTIV